MSNEIIIPKLDNNSERAILSWKVQEGEKVKKGQPLCTIETMKTVEDLSSEYEGVIHIFPENLSEAVFNIPIALIFEDENELNNFKKQKYG